MREDLQFPDHRVFTGSMASLPTHSLAGDSLGCVESQGLGWLASLGSLWKASQSPLQAGQASGRGEWLGRGRPDPILNDLMGDRPEPLLFDPSIGSATTTVPLTTDHPSNVDVTVLGTTEPSGQGLEQSPAEPLVINDSRGASDPAIATEQSTDQSTTTLVLDLPSTPVVDPSVLTGHTPPVLSEVSFSNLVFSGAEGSAGTVQIRLNQAPTTPVTLTLSPGNFLAVDADNNLQNGTQTTLTFTADNWNQVQTVGFIAEVDGVATDRTTGNAIAYSLSGGLTETGTYDLGVITNTYAPDLTRFNIDLDFRNDTTGFWTPERQAIAQQAADAWAVQIANEWDGLQLNAAIGQLGNDGNYTAQTFTTQRYVDDLVVFVNTIDTNGTAGGYGVVEYDFGGWISSPSLQPRVGQIAIDPAVGDVYLYNAVLHELGHTLGLVGLNWNGFLQQNLSTPQTATFNGLYTQAAYGGVPMPLQSQDGANPVTGAYDYWHPANSVYSVMSYGWLYSVTTPTAIDFAMLADSGYQVYGVNVPALSASSDPLAIAA